MRQPVHLKPVLTEQDLVDHAERSVGGRFAACGRCDGTGYIRRHNSPLGFAGQFDRLEQCRKCDGSGRTWISGSFRERVVRKMFRILVIIAVIGGLIAWFLLK